jgi:hypothetical protein
MAVIEVYYFGVYDCEKLPGSVKWHTQFAVAK